MPRVRVVKWGNNLAVRIPKSIADAAHIKEGDSILIALSRHGIEVRNVERVPSLEELVAQITPKNRHKEISFGPERGREKVAW